MDFGWKRERPGGSATLPSLFLTFNFQTFDFFIHLSPRWGKVGAPGGHAYPFSTLPLEGGKQPYRVDVTDVLKVGGNTLKIAVVNLWINRLIGDAAKPEDSKRDDKGILQSSPNWALSGGSSPSGRRSFVTIPLWKPDEERVPSGLLGPANLMPTDK